MSFEVVDSQLSLKCALSQARIRTAVIFPLYCTKGEYNILVIEAAVVFQARGDNCRHRTCFDLESFEALQVLPNPKVARVLRM